MFSTIFLVTLQSPSPSGKDSPEQRSFRDRQKYFEIDVKQQTPEKPKPRVSLVGEDDLKKMREEEGMFPVCHLEHPLLVTNKNIRLGWPRPLKLKTLSVHLTQARKFEQRAQEYLLDEDEEDEEEDLAKQMAQMKATGKVLLDGVEYNVEPVSTPAQHCSTPPSYNVTPPSYCGSSG